MDVADERIDEALPELVAFIVGEPIVREGERYGLSMLMERLVAGK